ncbi:hypothetical protein B0H13DRAFT_1885367 [Mycena leptocephala]|nr:hypothetical protein B0H13DRAFT_1885367 [Mycena leptocephala]
MEPAWGASQRRALGEALSRALWGAAHKKKGLWSVGTKSTLDLGGPKGREKGSPHWYHLLSSSDDGNSGDDNDRVEILMVDDDETNIDLMDEDVTPNAVASPSNLDVVMLTSLPKPSPESQCRMKYLDTRVNARRTAEEDRAVYHQKCLQQWHEQGDQNSQRLVQCPTCKHGAKPVHLAWVAPGSAETAVRQEKKASKSTRRGAQSETNVYKGSMNNGNTASGI